MYIGAVAAAQLSSNSNEFANIFLEQDKDHLEWLRNAMRVSCTDVHSILTGVHIILFHFARGIYYELREHLASSFNEWVLNLFNPSYASPLFVPHCERRRACLALWATDLWTNPSAAWSLNGFVTAYGFGMHPVTLSTTILQARRFSSVKAHPHPIHIIFWSMFFGPIIILMPCLLVLEVIILLLFNLNFITHGLLPGTQILSLFFFYICPKSLLTPILLGSPGDKYESLKEQFMESRESLFAYVESATAKFNKWTVESPPLLVARLMAGIFGFLILIGIWSGWWWSLT